VRQDLNEVKKVLDKHGYSINTIICDVMKTFNFKTLCWKAGAVKEDGYGVSASNSAFIVDDTSVTISMILYIFLSYFRRMNAYETIGGLFERIKDELCEKNIAQRLWELFDELSQVVIDVIAKNGSVDISAFRNSPEYLYIKELFETLFLSKQMFEINKSA